MTTVSPLAAARGHIIFLSALVVSAVAILYIEDQLDIPISPLPRTLAEAPASADGYAIDLGTVSTAQNAASLWEQVRATAPEVASLPLLLRDAGVGFVVIVGPVLDERKAEKACTHLIQLGVACQVTPYAASAPSA